VSREPVREVPVRGDVIRLGQLLKLAGLIDSGADAKAVVESGEVTVDGRVETRRGRQLRDGDVVALGGTRVRVVCEP
jgi:ribosome-associated protein